MRGLALAFTLLPGLLFAVTLDRVEVAASADKNAVVVSLHLSAKVVPSKLGTTLDRNGHIDRVFLDLPGTRLSGKVKGKYESGTRHVVAVRTGQFRKDVARVVVDTAGLGQFHLSPGEGPILRLTLEAAEAVLQPPDNSAWSPPLATPGVTPAAGAKVRTSASSAPPAEPARVPPPAKTSKAPESSPAVPSIVVAKAAVLPPALPSAPAASLGVPPATGGTGKRRLVVRTIPTEVEVYLGETFLGLTPFIDLVPVSTDAPLRLRLLKDNYEELVRELDVASEEMLLVTEILAIRQ
ncbi:MAG: hypothetical protein A2284_08010 [Deltaproteobacteria bacterium RIFOXYA12_FULL_61_11]|nr:MAG: hypothetical protein A2284_08010 [Deltaproteobacteria bacterium RIFOXYA12_FULL_61_11]